ncbi:hypothetical protein SAMN05216332_10220 [Nitrosospira briensis]|nr:hypothetical protein SAMN05216332_10220 [Nitrosospira briensis]
MSIDGLILNAVCRCATAVVFENKPAAGLLAGLSVRVTLLAYQMMSSFLEQFLQFTALVQFAHDIGTADELAIDIKLRNRGPV